MISPIDEQPVALAKGKHPSREDVLRTLSRLGANLGVRYCRANQDGMGIDDVQALVLSCTRDAWVGSFGEPVRVTEHHEPMTARSLRACHCWEQQCAEGVVKCIGRLFERLPDGSRVIVLQVSFAGSARQTTGEQREIGRRERAQTPG